MAYNLLAETDRKIDWTELNHKIYKKHMSIEFVPMPELGIKGGDALGISIPSQNAGNKAWEELHKVMEILRSDYGFTVYELYLGEEVDDKSIGRVKKNLLG